MHPKHHTDKQNSS